MHRVSENKAQRHTVSPLEEYSNANRLAHIHTDIVGPPPTLEGKRYLITLIDRATRWPEAFPVGIIRKHPVNITSETVPKVIYEGWTSRFGCTESITSATREENVKECARVAHYDYQAKCTARPRTQSTRMTQSKQR